MFNCTWTDSEYRACYRSLRRYFSRRSVPEDDLMDLQQIVFMKLLSIKNMDNNGYSNSYIYSVAHSVFVDYLIKLKKNSLCLSLSFDEIIEDDLISNVGSVSPFLSPDEALLTSELVSNYHLILLKLSPVQRETFYLCKYKNMSLKEAASCRGISVSGIERSLQKTFAVLKQLSQVAA